MINHLWLFYFYMHLYIGIFNFLLQYICIIILNNNISSINRYNFRNSFPGSIIIEYECVERPVYCYSAVG